MRRRPWPIVILAVLQCFLEPFNNLFMNAWLSGVTPKQYVGFFVHQAQWLTLFYLFVLPIVMGASVYAMKKWSYAIFVLGATWMLIENFAEVRAGEIPPLEAIALYLGNLAFVGYFLIPKVHAPFLNPRLRWWESKPRYYVSWPCRVSSESAENLAGRVADFSEGGAFVAFEQAGEALESGATILLRFGARSSLNADEILSVGARVAFSRPVGEGRGYGLQFVELNSATRRKLKKLARELKTTGVSFRCPKDSAWAAFLAWARKLVLTGQGFLPELEPELKTAPAVAEKRRELAS